MAPSESVLASRPPDTRASGSSPGLCTRGAQGWIPHGRLLFTQSRLRWDLVLSVGTVDWAHVTPPEACTKRRHTQGLLRHAPLSLGGPRPHPKAQGNQLSVLASRPLTSVSQRVY